MSNNEIKTVVFISNFFNHHQKPFSDAMSKLLCGGYTFIETEKMPDERKNMGWSMENYPDYVVSVDALNAQMERYIDIINKADFVITGSAPEKLIQKRKKLGKPIFRCSERPLKEREPLKYLPRMVKWHIKNPPGKPIYMLCASGYTAGDYAKFGLFADKCYKWGYFTELREYEDARTLIEKKAANSILWAARFIELKHPETCIEVAKRLRADGYDFTLRMIGDGPMAGTVRGMIDAEGLGDRVLMTGSLKPGQVREYMENSRLFMLTSDRREGWGAVLNEAMNSACAVVASRQAGAVPFLVEDGKNGMTYSGDDIDELYCKIKWLIDNRDDAQKMAENAYSTIKNEWNADNAAKKLLVLMQRIVNKDAKIQVFDKGVCSLSK